MKLALPQPLQQPGASAWVTSSLSLSCRFLDPPHHQVTILGSAEQEAGALNSKFPLKLVKIHYVRGCLVSKMVVSECNQKGWNRHTHSGTLSCVLCLEV